jgi:HAD superfamily phosphoserine phosphatase-like hydrolase
MAPAIVVSDMDGTLTTAEAWRGVLRWLGEHHPSPAARRFVTVRLPRVVLVKAGLVDKETFRARWFEDMARLLAGLPAERLGEMGEWVVESSLWPARRHDVIRLVERALAEAREADPEARLVVATGAYEPIADAFARRMGAHHALGTPLEIVDGRATGRLTAPVGSGSRKAAVVRALAAEGTVAAAFGDTGGDIEFLRLAGRAVAVAPDRELRREATRAGWEIVEPE